MHNDFGHTWAVVLAAGEGTRLRTLTTRADGAQVPKQFCSLSGGCALVEETLQRAAVIADPQRICTVVAQPHRQWWEAPLRILSRDSIIVQPSNRGTGIGVLLALLHILERDPEANIVLLPSDHHVRDELLLGRALKQAVHLLQNCERELILLGAEPDEIDADLGYIVPSETVGQLRRVASFIEKPTHELARDLIAKGALWNVFIVAARARALLDIYALRFPAIVAAMREAIAHDAHNLRVPIALSRLYESLPNIDFSRHIAHGNESLLRVLPVAACGWSDLGTPTRVGQTLARIGHLEAMDHHLSTTFDGKLNLATQYAHYHQTA